MRTSGSTLIMTGCPWSAFTSLAHSSFPRGLSIKAMSAPASSAARRRLTPSSNACSPASLPPNWIAFRASVRAMMRKSGFRLAATAAAIRSV